MIADTAVFSSSPWGSEMLFNKDLFMFSHDDKADAYNLDMDISTLEAELERVKSNNHGVEAQRMNDTLNSASCSVAGSECSDEACVDFEPHISDDLFVVIEDQEFLDSSLSHILEENITENSNVMLDWVEEDDIPLTQSTALSLEDEADIDNEVVIPSMPSSPCSPRSPSLPPPSLHHLSKIKKHCCILDDTKLWCEMCDEEQITTVEELSRMISEELGLREQLDVIRIINPQANISPTDTEFIIDLDYLDDDKLQEVRDYIRQHQKCNSSRLTSCDSCNETNSPVQKKHSKKQSRERRSQQKELRQRQRKEYRQMMKERRSGLFKKEEVLSLSSRGSPVIDPDGGEGDIDILE